MKVTSKIRSIETLACDAGWRNYHFVKLTTEDGIVGWSEYDEGFGAPGVTAAIERLSARVVGKNAFQHERIYVELFAATRPAAGGGATAGAMSDAAMTEATGKAAVAPRTSTEDAPAPSAGGSTSAVEMFAKAQSSSVTRAEAVPAVAFLRAETATGADSK